MIGDKISCKINIIRAINKREIMNKKTKKKFLVFLTVCIFFENSFIGIENLNGSYFPCNKYEIIAPYMNPIKSMSVPSMSEILQHNSVTDSFAITFCKNCQRH